MPERFALLCTGNSYGPPRLAHALTRAGVEVCVVAPPGSYASLTRFKFADLLLPAKELQLKLPGVVSILADEFKADLVLAGDDVAFAALARLVERAGELSLSSGARGLLKRSLPDAQRAATLVHDCDMVKSRLQSACPPPPSIANPSAAEAVAFASSVGFPVLIKREGFSAGRGVFFCRGAPQLSAAIGELNDTGRKSNFLVQKWIEGATYAVTVCGLGGKPLAAFSFIKHMVHPQPFGPTSVAKPERREDIIADALDTFETCGLSGFAGLDYVVDGAGRARFLEINPRIVPTSHLGEAFGADLVAALLAEVRGEPGPALGPARHEHIALYPGEVLRDPQSPYLSAAFHDLPAEDPEVLAAMRVAKV